MELLTASFRKIFAEIIRKFWGKNEKAFGNNFPNAVIFKKN